MLRIQMVHGFVLAPQASTCLEYSTCAQVFSQYLQTMGFRGHTSSCALKTSGSIIWLQRVHYFFSWNSFWVRGEVHRVAIGLWCRSSFRSCGICGCCGSSRPSEGRCGLRGKACGSCCTLGIRTTLQLLFKLLFSKYSKTHPSANLITIVLNTIYTMP